MKRFTTIEDVNTISGFFTQYKARKPNNFNELFEDTDTTDLDNLLTDVYGMRVFLEQYEKIFLSDGAETLINRLVSACDMLYFNSWKSAKDTIGKALSEDVSLPLSEIRESTENRESSDKTETQNRANAFDDIDNASDTDSTETNGNGKIAIGKKVRIDKSNGKTPSENAKTKLDFSRYNDFLTIVLNDIVSFCTIAIAI